MRLLSETGEDTRKFYIEEVAHMAALSFAIVTTVEIESVVPRISR